MKSKTTISRDNKVNMLLKINAISLRLLIAKREYLSLISGWAM